MSDGKVASDLIAMLPSQIQKVALTLVGDGGFIGELLTKVAQERGWTIVNTDLPGRKYIKRSSWCNLTAALGTWKNAGNGADSPV